MRHIIKLLIVIIVVCNFPAGYGQVVPTPRTAKDTARIFRNIEKYSKRSKFTKLLHKMVFEPVEQKTANPIRRKKKKRYVNVEGKIIRNIYITTLDPFGYSVSDTTRKPKSWAERTGNRIHVKSTQLAIKNILLLKKNKPLDSLLVRESERLIRTQRFINSVVITSSLTAKNSDSVDVYVRVLDSWSLIPKASFSGTRTSFELIERNFLGTGHEFNNRLVTRLEDGKQAYRTKYVVPNILNTFIKTTLSYQIDLEDNYGKSINVERGFYSPFTKWAGGVYLDQQFTKDSLPDPSMDYALQNFKYNSQDVWGGRAIRIFKGNTETARTTNLILSGRVLNVQYKERPSAAYDPIQFFSGETFYLSGVGISTRQFVEDRYLFNNGIVEDVPIGRLYGITGGYQQKAGQGRMYLGARASFGNYFRFGYLSANFEAGTFFRNSVTEQTTFSFQSTYFTDLIDVGRWKFRQFVKPLLIIGINRLDSQGDRMTINESSGFQGNYGAGFLQPNPSGMPGFMSSLFGTQKALLALQTQFYSPWRPAGFRFNPYFNYTAALLSDEGRGLGQSRLYSKVGVGFIISNDYLVFSSFQLSIAFFPSIPGSGSNIFQTNSFETTDFGLQDFELAKPRVVIFK